MTSSRELVDLPSRTWGPREMFSLGAAGAFLGGMLTELTTSLKSSGGVVDQWDGWTGKGKEET